MAADTKKTKKPLDETHSIPPAGAGRAPALSAAARAEIAQAAKDHHISTINAHGEDVWVFVRGNPRSNKPELVAVEVSRIRGVEEVDGSVMLKLGTDAGGAERIKLAGTFAEVYCEWIAARRSVARLGLAKAAIDSGEVNELLREVAGEAVNRYASAGLKDQVSAAIEAELAKAAG